MKNLAIPIKYGILIAIGLIAYFLLLSIVGMQTNPIFSLGNGIIVGFGLYKVMERYKIEKGSKFKYQKGFMTGLYTGFNATMMFSVFFAVYITNLNTNFLPEMLSNWSPHYHIGVGTVVFIAAVMGISTTFVLTLTFTQLFKNTWNTTKSKSPYSI